MVRFDASAFAALREGLDGDEVHLWLWRLDDDPAVPDLGDLLDGDERRRAERYLSPDKRRIFIAAHGLVRVLLGGYLDASPETIAVRTNGHGKPGLGEGGPSFNLAHSGGHILVGIARDGDMGVDVEEFRPVPDAVSVAGKILGEAVAGTLRGLEGAARDRAFLDAWTRMEARSKALGGPFSPSADAGVLTVVSVDLGSDCLAAVARRGSLDRLSVRRVTWPDTDTLSMDILWNALEEKEG